MGSPKTFAFLGLYSPPVFMESLKNQGFLRLITKRCENIFITNPSIYKEEPNRYSCCWGPFPQARLSCSSMVLT